MPLKEMVEMHWKHTSGNVFLPQLVILNTDQRQRYEWDILMCDLELVESYDGHYGVVYGTYDPKYLSRWHSKQDFVFSRQWFRGQDGAYTILQFPAIHKKKPQRSGYRRAKINPSLSLPQLVQADYR
ncbi:hypothetical protein PIB30_097010 [Stylosanthes scabra]|uniref:START domain-containing protein n=1 Tax=Stylosanthes scabra TaxID=79078 RepID=A0ABU6RWK5_9FABA|nr:hypothetical protein [Stylosanthes scabra]